MERYRQRKLASWLTALAPPFVLAVALYLYGGLWALSLWPNWVLIGGLFVYLVYASRAEVVTAGADWLKIGKHWVKTYELTGIEYQPRGMNGYELVLSDETRTVRFTPRLIQANRKIWDLVHLGMRYSVANGAELNNDARAAFPEIDPAATGEK
ncbi:hypothetical protein GIY23_04995 [Allosaccharopolyspora coralli]|uniref:PH domain-containing protein n=1 Tax=Allosaccharopolyspora coralli TaxID=2665642 RepID=A0A5Q3QBK2_9PSEU|nr:hypothetical protein [Allosaccharopolyspora coralli]QGK68979.1 hypothetical protein GIY23_04995 [Allosaccharopolyspora coralli]